jgi:3-carboxy-cis,cis-muconate cycloisomerase
VIESQCDANLYSIEKIAREAALAGNVAIPMVKQLTSLVAKADEKASAFVHYGATSQDAIDTGLVLQLREALEEIGNGLSKISSALVRLVEAHDSTLVVGRTWLQHAPPVTLGLKAAGWLAAIERHHARLNQTQKDVLVIQFGGAVGTLAALGDRGPAVASALADDLKLSVPDLPWHAHRDLWGCSKRAKVRSTSPKPRRLPWPPSRRRSNIRTGRTFSSPPTAC